MPYISELKLHEANNVNQTILASDICSLFLRERATCEYGRKRNRRKDVHIDILYGVILQYRPAIRENTLFYNNRSGRNDYCSFWTMIVDG